MNRKLKISLNAPAVLGFSMACVIATLLGMLTNGGSTRLLFSTYRASMASPLAWLRLFTHVLGHSGMEHLLGNLSFILLLGPALEEKYGPGRILLVILAAGLVTGAVHNLLYPNTILCGASGVCFAFILMTSFTGFRDGEIPLTFILVAVIYLGQQLWDMIAVRDQVSNLSHLIGGLVGAAAGYLMNMRKTGERSRYGR